jgi:hypothetical protein
MFKLNQNEGTDTLHIEHPYEECNSDDAKDMTEVDAATAKAMLDRGDAVACKHCKPEIV